MNPLVHALLASAVLAALLADARQLCGKSLVKHVGGICRDVECDSLEDLGAKRQSYSGKRCFFVAELSINTLASTRSRAVIMAKWQEPSHGRA